ncbi:hypothetical protein ACN9MZ_14550 [Pseudoduganella sp. S-14]|uniref:hypothetical protein n=1 Tax=Pseudoduganella sp. S-14 TaxID=3404065 RepID=UPI003CEF4D8A
MFLDTEFTDFLDPQLISLGLAADSGEEFYAELPFPDSACSAFVREAILPLLGAYPEAACSFDVFRREVIHWLESVRPPDDIVFVCVDYQTDWDLFVDALDYRLPDWCRFQHVGRNINELLRYEYHKSNGLPEHHALHDACANRYAYRERPPVSR